MPGVDAPARAYPWTALWVLMLAGVLAMALAVAVG